MHVHCMAKLSIYKTFTHIYVVVNNLWLTLEWYTHMLWSTLNGAIRCLM